MAFATLAELKDRLEWTLSQDEERLASATLEDLSDSARFYGRDEWPDAPAAPRPVRNIVLQAAARFLRNPDGYITSRAGDETVTFTDRGRSSGAAEFTSNEIKMLRRLAGQRGIVTVHMVHDSDATTEEPGYVPAVGGKPFPYYPTTDGPW